MRNKFLDLIRFLAAFSVILIHSPLPGKIGQTVEAVSRVAVPLFFMVSGYYAAVKSKKKLLLSARKTAIILLWSVGVYFAWGILWSVYKGTTAEYLNSIFSVRCLLETVVINNGVLLGHLWFLLALLYCYLLYAWLFTKAPLFVRICISVTLYAGFFVVREILKANGISDPVYYLRNFLFVGIPFFLLGGIVHRLRDRLLRLPAFVWLLIACVGITAAVVERFWVGCCDLYIGTGIAVVALFVFAQKPELSVGNVLASLGEKFALDIYVFHSVIITILNGAASVAGVLNWGVFPWLRPAIVLIMSIGVAYLRYSVKKKLLKSRTTFCDKAEVLKD